MTLKTFPFDAAEYMKTPESQAYLLRDALESGHAGYIAKALGVIARARGMTQIAKDAGVSRTSLFKALSSSGAPQLSTLMGVVNALGLKLSISERAA